MVWSVEWDGAYVVGGDGALRLTPNFRLREFRRADGSVRVHRELVSAIQLLRNRFGAGVSIVEVAPDGLEAVVAGEPAEALFAAADELEAHRLFSTATLEAGGVRLRIAEPTQPAEVGLEQALETAFSVTAAFETSGDRFRQVTGNFDGAGLSFGPAQSNFASGSLTPLFHAFREADEPALRACFGDEDDWREWLRVLELPKSEQIAWADERSTGTGKHLLVEPWNGYLRAVGAVAAFRAIMVERILREYGARLLAEVRYLESLAPVTIDHVRPIAALYDLVIQQGSLAKAKEAIEARVAAERPADQFALVRIAVEERGRTAGSRWQADCVSRRLGVLTGVPTPAMEAGREAQRANHNFYMLRNARVVDAAAVTAGNVDEELARVSRALATGSSLLA